MADKDSTVRKTPQEKATDIKIRVFMEMSKEDLAALTVATIDTLQWSTNRMFGLLRDIGMDPVIVQALMEMDDDTFNYIWNDAPNVEVIAVKARTSDN
jgi:hypothetical protein